MLSSEFVGLLNVPIIIFRVR